MKNRKIPLKREIERQKKNKINKNKKEKVYSIHTEISRRLVGSPREFHFFFFLVFHFLYFRHHKTVVLLNTRAVRSPSSCHTPSLVSSVGYFASTERISPPFFYILFKVKLIFLSFSLKEFHLFLSCENGCAIAA